MSQADYDFYDNQKQNPPIGYCSSSVERKGKISNQRKMDRQNRSRDESYSFQNTSVIEIDMDDVNDDNDADPSYISKETDSDHKQKYQYECITNEAGDILPTEYRHIRNGPRSVRPEIYTVVAELQAQYNMSHRQAEGAITVVANQLFGRSKYGEWKIYDKHSVTDCNTMPAMSNIRRTEPYIEAMAMNMIVEELMHNGMLTLNYFCPSKAIFGSYEFTSL